MNQPQKVTANPVDLLQDLERVLISEGELADRIERLGAEISRDYAGRDLVLISVLKGGIVFLADLMRRITIPHAIELVGASSYKGGTVALGGVRVTKDVDQSIAGKDVLLVEDIYDTGNTLHVIHDLLRLHNPASLEICALLRKTKPQVQKLGVRYLGFDIDDVFVVGYGLDFKERYRNLPCIGVLKHALYE
ncbi:MAG TPA: hypoxanthine phosphoribosyltransferase [Candidatus Sumerlaeota bacterium]|nr:MAG: Hypoxanthine-guanine phosphoribosyltransferase [candidate division BRC1 bacterium ADurb.BinA292]HOE97451.1 hypoxanthine phosphoribosyltransferase [Candidatus Sumerlaeota bacterium]HPK01739.1 hypoxanthine phosphoribosyltransferase [Candidatus Sumerlaeota bacterium]